LINFAGQSPTSSDADDDDDEWHPTAHHHSIGKKRRWVDHQRRPLRSNNGELVNVDECQLVMAPAMANELLGELPKCEECDVSLSLQEFAKILIGFPKMQFGIFGTLSTNFGATLIWHHKIVKISMNGIKIP
jgi:hypothetical protein